MCTWGSHRIGAQSRRILDPGCDLGAIWARSHPLGGRLERIGVEDEFRQEASEGEFRKCGGDAAWLVKQQHIDTQRARLCTRVTKLVRGKGWEATE
eukprot:3122597-Pleurochrysis_carterae.AAC.1